VAHICAVEPDVGAACKLVTKIAPVGRTEQSDRGERQKRQDSDGARNDQLPMTELPFDGADIAHADIPNLRVRPPPSQSSSPQRGKSALFNA